MTEWHECSRLCCADDATAIMSALFLSRDKKSSFLHENSLFKVNLRRTYQNWAKSWWLIYLAASLRIQCHNCAISISPRKWLVQKHLSPLKGFPSFLCNHIPQPMCVLSNYGVDWHGKWHEHYRLGMVGGKPSVDSSHDGEERCSWRTSQSYSL